MSKTYAYIRVSTDKQDANNQRLEILEYARQRKLHVDHFTEVALSSRRTSKDRRIDELVGRLQTDDTLIVSELSRLGRSTDEVIALVKALNERHIRLIAIKQGIDINGSQDMASKVIITIFSLLAELERDLISARTKEALATKKRSGVRLGKPVGTLQKSKFDKDREKIEKLLGYKVSVIKIAEVLGYPTSRGLNNYVNTRIKRKT